MLQELAAGRNVLIAGNAKLANEWRFALRPFRGGGILVIEPKNQIKSHHVRYRSRKDEINIKNEPKKLNDF